MNKQDHSVPPREYSRSLMNGYPEIKANNAYLAYKKAVENKEPHETVMALMREWLTLDEEAKSNN